MKSILLAGLIASAWPAGEALASCAAPVNAIEAENCLPGSPQSAWDISPAIGDPTIEGFATDISYNRGETASFKVKAASAYRIDIYRLGYYGGMGGRLVAQVNPTGNPAQPACLTDATTGLIDCGNWAVTATWAIPADAVSGVYAAKLVRLATGGASHVIFVVRNDGGTEKILFQTSDATWQAYNPWGGNSLYIGHAPVSTGAYKVSYNRPLTVRLNYPTSLFHQEYPMLRWLEANGYDVAYFANVDAERRGASILDHEVFLSVGHDEYWSAGQRASIEAARAAGVHLGFFSATTSLWKTRWENSISAGASPHRTIACYKESTRGSIDPSPAWTGFWRDHRGGDANRPENALTGAAFGADAIRNDPMVVPAQFGRLRFWRNTSVAALAPGQSAVFPQTVGLEWDVDKLNDSRPPGLIRMSSSTVEVHKALDYLLYETTAAITHRLLLYKHAGGALVFGAGTMHWGWGLESVHNGGSGAPVQMAMRQATVNLLADMGAQPASLQPGLIPASPSTDTTPPTAAITPAAGALVGQTQVLTGSASDAGGGVVGGVEISTNDGLQWRPAEGTDSWRYAWLVTGPSTVRVRAVDDSGNLGAPSTPLTITPGAGPPAGPVVSAISPSTAAMGGAGFTLTVMGSGYMNGSTVRWNGTDRPTIYVSPTMLQAFITAGDIAAPGAKPVSVVNPGGTPSVQSAAFMVLGFTPLQLDQAKVFPNPWRADRHAGLPVTFGSLPPSATVKVFTAAGRWVRTLRNSGGSGLWDLRDDDGNAAASGYYHYLITDGEGRRRRGVLALIR